MMGTAMNECKGEIAAYESMAEASRNMLIAARCSDWDTVIELERECAALIATLRAHTLTPLDQASRARKLFIVRALLADDAEIRHLAEPWMADLQRFIGHTRVRRDLHNAYS